MEPVGEPVKVFISYSHDNEEHMGRVRELSDRLRSGAIDCWIDQYETAPPEGWPQWMEQKIDWADFVLMVCTDTYCQRVLGNEDIGQGRGVAYEGSILLGLLHDAGMRNEKTIPVLFEGTDTEDVPRPLRSYTRYRLWDHYENLYRHLTGQPLIVPGKLGHQIEELPPVGRAWPPSNHLSEANGTTQDRKPSHEPETFRPPRKPWLIWINLLLIGALLYWNFRYSLVETATVPFVLGVFVWIFRKFLSDHLRSQLQRHFENLLLHSRWMTLGLSLVLAMSIVWILYVSRPALILRPSPLLLEAAVARAESEPLSLEVWRDGKLLGRLDPYRGEAILVGRNQISSEYRNRLYDSRLGELELHGDYDYIKDLATFDAALKRIEIVGRWEVLRNGERLYVKGKTAQGNDYGTTPVTIRDLAMDSPQEEIIYEP